MQRRLAFLLAGCLAISPVSAGFSSAQAYAAETESAEAIAVTVQVKDENSALLTADSQYSLTAGETRRLTAEFDHNSGLYQIKWSSEDSGIVSIDDGGTLTALSAGTTGITLEVTSPDSTGSAIFKYEISVSEPEETVEEIDEEVVEETSEVSAEGVAAEASTEEAAAEGAAAEASTEEAVVAASTEEAAPEDKAETEAAVEVTTETEAAAEGNTSAEVAAEIEPGAEVTAETVETLTAEKNEAAANAEASVTQTGWVGSGNSWSYIQADGSKATGFLKLGDRTFYLDADGALKYGWIKDGSKYYFADDEGALKTGWMEYNGFTYYLDPSTFARKTGIQKIDGKLYVFSDHGKRRTGCRWVNTSQGKVYVDADNTLHTGWLTYKNRKYYFKSSGIMNTGRIVIRSKIYWMNSNGVMITGWYTNNGKKYYFGKDGYALKGFKTIDGKRYYFNKGNGAMFKGWYKPGGKIYYFCGKGHQVTGFKKIKGSMYYLRYNGAVVKGWKKIRGKWYYFKNCKARTGWLTLGSRKFYLGTNGAMVTGTKTIDGVTYRFNSDGVLISSNNNYTTTEEFIQCIAPLVQKYAPRYNVKVCSPIIAQAILESASGQSSLGKKYNNFFGLKCGTLWTGPSVNMLTGEEYTAGTYTTIAADFRVYSNMEEGVKGYFEFLFKNRTRYNNLIGETDPYEYLVKIKADGYATSSKYVQNTYNVLKSYNLTRFDN